MIEVKAKLNYLRIAPRKVRLVANLIKGKSVIEAKNNLNFLLKKSAIPILKLLNSAINNAKNRFNMDENNLYIKTCIVNEGYKLKRWKPRAFGRAGLIKKRTSNIEIVLTEKENKDLSKKIYYQADKKDVPEKIQKNQDLKEEHQEHKHKQSEIKIERTLGKKMEGVRKKLFQRKAV